MITQKEISELTDYAKKILSGRPDLYPKDVVQDILMSAIEKRITDFPTIKQLVKKLAYGEKNARTKKSTTTYSEKEVSRYCNCCKEDLPIAMFYIHRYADPKKKPILSYYCKKCSNKKAVERYRRKNPIYKQKYFTPEQRKKAHLQKTKESYHRRKLLPGFMEKMAANSRERYKNNRDAGRSRSKRYYYKKRASAQRP